MPASSIQLSASKASRLSSSLAKATAVSATTARSASPFRHQPQHPQASTTTNSQPSRSRSFFSTQPPKMSTMPASHGHSAPCCNIPPVVTKGYQQKGAYEDIGGFKTYVTGPADATKAIVVVYDIFGYFEQTIQGADILAYSDDHQKYKVFMPDWFEGKPVPIEWYPPDTEEKQKNLGEFFGKHPPPGVADKTPGYVDAIKSKNPSLSKFAILGYCWGGKVATLSVKAANNPFSAAASVHPAMVDAADAEGINVPFALLASQDEPVDDVKNFESALKVSKHVERFDDQIHGWMAARSDLSDARVKQEYERGYKTLLTFYNKNF